MDHLWVDWQREVEFAAGVDWGDEEDFGRGGLWYVVFSVGLWGMS